MTLERRNSVISHSVFLIVWVGLLVLASFKDLEISKLLSDSQSFIGALFAKCGEWPAYAILPICSVILFHNGDLTARKGINIAIKTLFAVMVFAGWFLWCYMSTKLVEDIPHLLGFSIVFSAGLTFMSLYFTRNVDKAAMKRLFKFAIFAIVVLAVTHLLISVLKSVWSRERFRDMLKIGSYDGFTPWYLPNGIREVEGFDLTSFPSGHTASACNIFVITVLCDILPKWKNRKLAVYTVCIAFTCAVALFRVVYNAHFLSDTLWGGMIAYAVFYVFKCIFFRKGKFVFSEEKDEKLQG